MMESLHFLTAITDPIFAAFAAMGLNDTYAFVAIGVLASVLIDLALATGWLFLSLPAAVLVLSAVAARPETPVAFTFLALSIYPVSRFLAALAVWTVAKVWAARNAGSARSAGSGEKVLATGDARNAGSAGANGISSKSAVVAARVITLAAAVLVLALFALAGPSHGQETPRPQHPSQTADGPAPRDQADPAAGLEDLLARAEARAEALKADIAPWAQKVGQPPLDPKFAKDLEAISHSAVAAMERGAPLQADPALRAFGQSLRGREGQGSAMDGGDGARAPGVVYVAVSLSMPPQALRALAADANRAGVRLVIRGLIGGSFKATGLKARQVFSEHEAAGLGIDPQVFRAFQVTSVPTFISAARRPEPCHGLDCIATPPAFDRIAGNVSLSYALRQLSQRGADAPEPARAALARLEGAP